MKIGPTVDPLAALLSHATSAGVNGQSGLNRAADAPGQPAAGSPAAASAPGSATTVRLSDAARALQQIEAAGGGSFDSRKVEAVRQELVNGTFSVNAQVVADRMLANAQELLGGSR